VRHKQLLIAAAAAVLSIGLCGCTKPLLPVVLGGFSWPEGAPSDARIASSFNQTVLKKSTSADVLSTIHNPKYELLSQSESILASGGEKKKGRKKWLNMVTFDENELYAKRKYFVVVDEAPSKVLGRQKCKIDIEMVLETEFLETPYANENARRIAVLRRVLANLAKDAVEVRQDNKTVDICAMVINQTLNTILTKLDSMPARAVKLSELSGLDFDHMSFGPGKIRMLIRDNVVKVKVKIGAITGNFSKHHDVRDM